MHSKLIIKHHKPIMLRKNTGNEQVEVKRPQNGIESDFHALYTTLKVMGIIQGSSRQYSADELIEVIKRVRAYFKEKKGDYYDLSMITNANGIRDRVWELIQKENTRFL